MLLWYLTNYIIKYNQHILTTPFLTLFNVVINPLKIKFVDCVEFVMNHTFKLCGSNIDDSVELFTIENLAVDQLTY